MHSLQRIKAEPDDGGSLPPHSVEAEQAVLGSLLLDPSTWNQVSDLRADDFLRADHRETFLAIAELHGQGVQADYVTLIAHLQQHDRIDKAGGLTYLGTLVRETPTAANIRAYANVIVDRGHARRLIALSNEIPRALADGSTPLEVAKGLQPVLADFIEAQSAPASSPLDWRGFAGEPPPRIWWLPEWLGPDPTLTAGPGGIGKSRVWQALATSLATGRPYLGPVTMPLRVLIWSCEEDQNEIWRMQAAINRHLDLSMADLTDRLYIVPRRGLENSLLELVMGRPMLTRLFSEQLRQQVNDLKADVLILDNIAQVFGGNENDRHQATMFVNAVAGLVRDRPFCSVLLGHPARSAGSEFAGSAAWENAVRMRWYLGPTLPNQPLDEDEPVDPDVIYLAKRKTNYTAKDWRRLRFRNGLFVPDEPEGRRFDQAYRDDDAERVVLEALPKLVAAGLLPTDARNGSDFLPTQILAKGFAQDTSKKELVAAMNRLMGAGRLRRQKVGQYANRSPRFGLVIP